MILSAAILLLVITPIAISIAVSLPIVQNKIIDRAALFATQYMGVEIAVERVDITVTGRIEVTEFLARDFDGDTMIYANHLSTSIDGFNIFNKRVIFGATVLDGGKVQLLQSAETGAINIRDVTSILVSETPAKRSLQLLFTRIDLEDIDLNIRQLKPKNPEYGFDPGNIEIMDIGGRVERLLIDGQTLNAYVEKIHARERSGLYLNELTGTLYLTAGALSLTDMRIKSPNSDLGIRYLGLADVAWRNFSEFNTSTALEIDISSGYISSKDIQYFAPSMRDWNLTLSGIDLEAKGSVHNLDLDIYNISYGTSDIQMQAHLSGLPIVESTKVDMTLDHLTTSANDIDSFMRAIAIPMGGDMPHDIIGKLGAIELSGTAKGTISDIDTKVDISTQQGGAKGRATINILEDGVVRLSGRMDGKSLNIGTLSGDTGLGVATFNTIFEGVVSGVDSDIKVESTIPSIVIKGYPLQNSSFAAHLSKGTIEGKVVSLDPNIDFTLDGSVGGILRTDKSEPFHPSFGLSLELRNLDLVQLGINRRDSTARVSGRLKGVGDGSSIENLRANIDILQGQYTSHRDTITTQEAILTMQSEEQNRYVNLTSDFLDFSLRSKSSVREITEYLREAIRPYMPIIYEAESSPNHRAVVDDYTTIRLKAHNLAPITNSIAQGLTIGEGSELLLRFNPVAELFTASLRAPYIESGTLLALDAKADIGNDNDQIVVASTFEELFVGVEPLYQSFIDARVKNNRIQLNCGFDNYEDGNSMSLNVISRVRRKSAQQLAAQGAKGWRREVDIDIQPSEFKRHNEPWNISSSSIMIDGEGLVIDQFLLKSGEQSLKVDGIISGYSDDALTVDMNDFNLSIFSPILSRFGYTAQGVSNGRIKAQSLLDKRRLEANVMLDSVRLNNIAAPAMALNAAWDSKLNQARLYISNRESRDTLVRGYYIPSQVKYYARINLKEFDMGMIDAPLSGIITETKGLATVDATLKGERQTASLNGTIEINDMESKVAYTNCRYRIPSALININDNELSCQWARVVDQENNEGELRLNLDLQHLSNINYSVALKCNNMTLLNTSESDNDLFYGTMYGTGLVNIDGAKGETKMNITMSTDDNSHFYMPLSHKSSIQAVEFITFVKPTIEQTPFSELRDRLLKERMRKINTSSSNLDINMTLDVKPNTEVQIVIDPKVGDIIKARGEGRLNLSINPQQNLFNIYGDYNIQEGSYLFTLQNIVNKRFVIDPGSTIQWVGSPTDAILGINAIYKLKASLQPLLVDESTRAVPVECIINLTESLTHPQVNFAIDFPSLDAEQQAAVSNLLNDQETISRQFFYLMLANSFISENQTAGSSNLASSTTAATGFELLTNQLSNWLSTSNYNVMIRYRPESDLAGDEVDFGFSKGLVGNRLLVELEGNYILDNKQAISEDASNFMGEAYITWLIDRAGGVKVRGFTQTIDSFDENQGLQETGIGLYYSEDFNNFKDLRERVKSRFTASPDRQEKRRKRKETKREARTARHEERKTKKNNKNIN